MATLIHRFIVRKMPKRAKSINILMALLIGLSILGASEGSAQPPATSTPSVLETLESESAPIKDGHGKTVTDINPSDVIHWVLAGHNFDASDKKLTLTLALTTEQQFTIYEDKVKFEVAPGWKIVSQKSPQTQRQFDPISRKDVSVFVSGAFDFVLEQVGQPDAAYVTLTYVGCTKVICLFPHIEKISIPWTPSTSLPSSQSTSRPTSNTAVIDHTPATASATSSIDSQPASNTPTGTVEEQFAQKVKDGQLSFAMLLLIAFAGGILTNLTPCVAPMIPITIRLLANQTVRPLTSSSMYALGIVATYTMLGVMAALSGALFGSLIAHPAVSIFFGVVMFLLGINMLGFGDLSRLQQIGGRIGSSKGGAFNAFLMGAGAGLVASPCTGPILASLLTYTAGRQNMVEAISLLGIYSVGFALPYVFLGASAAKISKLRVNFRIQILTKLVFASVMFGLALYFLRIPLYGVFTILKPHWSLIGGVGVTLGILLSALVLIRESLHHQKIAFLAPTITLGVGLFFGIQALTRRSNTSGMTVHWLHSEKEAFELASKEHKPILVDAWAEWCEACKKMDATTFMDPDVISEINDHWIPLKFDLTEVTDENSSIQDRYELPGLPTLTMLPVDANLKEKIAISGYTSASLLLENLHKNHKTLSKVSGL